MNPKTNQNDKHGAKREPKLVKELSKTSIAEQVRKTIGFDGILGQEKGAFFHQNLSKKKISKIIPKNDHPKTWNLMPKGCKNDAKIDAQTHQSY